MEIDLILFASPLHSQESIMEARKPLFNALKGIGLLNIIKPEDFKCKSADENKLTICFIATGGTEEEFSKIADIIPSPILIMSDGYHNSLAASFEIVTWLKQKGIKHKFINIPLSFNNLDIISELPSDQLEKKESHTFENKEPNSIELRTIYNNPKVKEVLSKTIIGLIGGQSSWLISSNVDKKYITEKYGVRFINIDIDEIINAFQATQDSSIPDYNIDNNQNLEVLKALRMTKVLENICKKYSLTALTIKCFDLLKPSSTTSCLALAILNDRGIVSGCEGDIPALWTMIVAKALYGNSTFMSNPSSASKQELSIDFAHCTIPLSLVKSYTLPTHFESNIGIGIAGVLPVGKYSIMKIGGERLDKLYQVDGSISENTNIIQRCRTQIKFKFPCETDYHSFFSNRLGNHVIIIPSNK